MPNKEINKITKKVEDITIPSDLKPIKNFIESRTGTEIFAAKEGANTISNGIASHAEGQGSNASGGSSHAEGSDTVAFGQASHAEGSNTTANGGAAHSEGYYTVANGQCSHAEGEFTVSNGGGSHSEGGYNKAFGQYGHVEGYQTTDGKYLTKNLRVIGFNDNMKTITVNIPLSIFSSNNLNPPVIGDKIFTKDEGYGTYFYSAVKNYDNVTGNLVLDASESDSIKYDNTLSFLDGMTQLVVFINSIMISGDTKYAHAEGKVTSASGQASHAEGYVTISSGNFSHAEGNETESSGVSSHAEGFHTLASGDYSHAEGSYNTASGINSHAEGSSTKAYGISSHAEGSSTKAYGHSSHAEGIDSIALSDYSHVEGRYSLGINTNIYAKILSYTDNKITVDNVNGINVNDELFVKVFNRWVGNVIVTEIDNVNNVLTLNSIVTSEWLYIFKKSSNNEPLHAEGFSTVAAGKYSHAEGSNSIALGNGSHAEGGSTLASGSNSHAEGINTTASGTNSHAEGGSTNAKGNSSHAEGQSTTTIGPNSHSEGHYTLAIGTNSAYEIKGYDNTLKTLTLDTVSGLSVNDNMILAKLNSYPIECTITAIDVTNKIVTLSTTSTLNGSLKFIFKKPSDSLLTGAHAEGFSTTAGGLSAHAEGNGTYATAQYSHAEGNGSVAKGSSSHAEGSNTTASGSSSHAEGNGSVASGNSSHAEGAGTAANGDYSHSEGSGTIATGRYSHAQNGYTTASGDYSHAQGNTTIADTFCSHVMGQYNKKATGTATTFSSTADAFIIGNGTSGSALANAIRATFDGKMFGLSAYNSTGADYAEYFEWIDGNPDNEDRVGYFVTMDGEKIRIANSNDDYILGIVSASPSVIGDSDIDNWRGMYLRDQWGRLVHEDVIIPAVIKDIEHEAEYDEEGNIIKEAWIEKNVEIEPERKEVHIRLNPNYDPNEEYIPREQRKEWSAIGMMGKLLTRDDGTCEVNGYCIPNDDGIATKSEKGYRVMKRVSENIIMVLLK